MRIISGAFRGTRLQGPGSAGRAGFRPTADRVRESLFNILMSMGDPVSDAVVLDLFAGTGALGLEALSRGAASVTFVEESRKALSVLRANIKTCRAGDQSGVLPMDARKLVSGTPHDLVFCDPPYGKGLGEAALARALAQGWITQGAVVVWEESAEIMPPEGLQVTDQRRYGETVITFLQAG